MGVNLGNRLSVVIPAFNERGGIGAVLAQLREALPEAEIIVIDDGSTDGTAEVVAGHQGVILAQHHFNCGYGGALKTGMRIATREYVAWFDADNEHRTTDLASMLQRMVGEQLVAIIGERRRSGPSPLRSWGKWVIRRIARTFSAKVGKDINCGLRIFRRDVIVRYLSLLPNGYSASITSTMIMLERGYPLAFHAVEMNSRVGTSKVRMSDGFMAIGLVLRLVMLFAPLRIFLPAGIFMAGFGVLYAATMIVSVHNGFPLGALLFILSGVMVAMFGLVADQVSQMRLSAFDHSSYRIHEAGRCGATALEKTNA